MPLGVILWGGVVLGIINMSVIIAVPRLHRKFPMVVVIFAVGVRGFGRVGGPRRVGVIGPRVFGGLCWGF